MVTLPDGTFMIMNGAKQGVAGFGLAAKPNLQALLYTPTAPVGQRVSILGTTTIARLYHSEATLMQDGRVLVSGSDPEDGVNPEELRMELYVPPYLSQGLRQPVVTIPVTEWAYGGMYMVNVQLFQGTTPSKISIVAATSSTHGNTMGNRILFPTFSCGLGACTVTAPPNAFVSTPGWAQIFAFDGPTPSNGVFVRIGGDPANIGAWPNMPGFTPPG